MRSLLLASTLLLAGCGGTIISLGGGCLVDGVTYATGDTVSSSCGEVCTCQADGSVACEGVPTYAPCGGCDYLGGHYEPGQWFTPGPDSCEECVCNEDGSVSCSYYTDCCGEGFTCGPYCTWEGVMYTAGESFPAGDGCNTCTCEWDGTVSCTLALCAGCTYQLATFAPGETWPAGDACGTCTCEADGSVICNAEGGVCACDPAAEWWRSYMGASPEACAVIDYDCFPSLSSFSNDCGCGCEQAVSLCPEVVDCGVFDCVGLGLEQQCPLSTFLYPDAP